MAGFQVEDYPHLFGDARWGALACKFEVCHALPERHLISNVNLVPHPFGFWRCHSSAAAPYRPHLLHPDSYRVVGYGEVARIAEPLNPAGAE